MDHWTLEIGNWIGIIVGSASAVFVVVSLINLHRGISVRKTLAAARQSVVHAARWLLDWLPW